MLFDVSAHFDDPLVLGTFHVFLEFGLERGDLICLYGNIINHKEQDGHHVQVEAAGNDDSGELWGTHHETVIPREQLLLRIEVEQGEAPVRQDQQQRHGARLRDRQLREVQHLRFLVMMQFVFPRGRQVR